MASDPLRPQLLEDFAGQPQLVEHLRVILTAATARGEMPDHLLFAGGPGLGKTTLAGIVAAELHVPLLVTSGPALERPGDVAALLSGLAGRSVLFIDEIHRTPRAAEEILYPAMEDQVLDMMVGEGSRARTVRMDLPDFTLVGATTQAGMLSGPLRDRFGFQGRLQPYPVEELTVIVSRSASLLGLSMVPEAAAAIASRSRGTPRIANRLVRRVRDWAQVGGVDAVDEATALAALDAFGVDSAGLDELGREVLEALCVKFAGGPVGIASLASSVGEATLTLEEVYEPFLLRLGFLARTRSGRVATAKAFEHLGLPVPPAARTSARSAPFPRRGVSRPSSSDVPLL